MKQLYFLFFIFTLQVYAQQERIQVVGKVKSDFSPIENVHIINKTTNKGSISNHIGEFNISIKENDTLIFSSIQYKEKWFIINNQHLKSLRIKLFQKTNNLPEVTVKNMAKSLGLPNAGKKPLNRLERNLNAYSQESVPIVILMAFIGKSGGIDDMYNVFSGNRKRDQKLKKLIDEDQKLELNQKYIQKIRNYFQDDFFLNTLQIPKERINLFIDYCLPKNIISLFNKKRHVEVIDIFIKENENFKSVDFK